MFKPDQIQSAIDLLSDSRLYRYSTVSERRIEVASLLVENRKAAAMERIADALTALAGKNA